LPGVDLLAFMLKACGLDCVQRFWTALELDGLRRCPPGEGADLSGMTPSGLIEGLCDTQKMQQLVADSYRHWKKAGSSKAPQGLTPQAQQYQLLHEVMNASKCKLVALKGGIVDGCSAPPGEAPWQSEVDDLLWLCHKYKAMCEALLGVLHARTVLVQAGGDLEDLKAPMDFALSRLHSIQAALETGPNVAKLQHIPWAFGVQQMQVWVAAAMRIASELSSRACTQAVHQARAKAKTLAAKLPVFQHYCNDDTWCPSLAAKTLVVPQSKLDALGKEGAALYQATVSVGRMQKALGVSALSAEAAEALKECSGTFASAKLAVAVMAAASCLLSLQGEEQARAARQLLSRQLPKALKERLQALVGAEGAKRPRASPDIE